MARTKKHLKQADINRNSSVKISHTIKKIKEHERRYTTILVIIFMFVFCIIGYFTLRVDSTEMLSDIKKGISMNEISESGQLVTLTENHIMNDEEGIKSDPYVFSIQNNTSNAFPYKIIFVKDEFLTKLCECENNTADIGMIRFSINDEENINTFTNNQGMIVKEGWLEVGQKEKINIHMWFSDQMDVNANSHYHGYFLLNKE